MSGLAVATATGAAAAPGDNGDDGEGGSKALIEQLEASTTGFVKARDALAKSKKRQADLGARIKQLDTQIGPQQARVDEIVAQSYRNGRIGPMSALLTASDGGGFLDRAEALQTVAARQNEAVADLKATKTAQERAKVAVDAAIRDQQKQVTLMSKRKTQAENALKAFNVGQDASSSSDGGGSARADAPSGNLNGGCSEPDPTTSGCLTKRTLHALKQAQSAGFTRYVACFREQSTGEHPKGRGCDFAAEKNGFGGVAKGGDKDYGDRLANYFINNADRLGVLYVIWFDRIWLISSGKWKAYSRGNGDPSSDHTNHVHLSMQ